MGSQGGEDSRCRGGTKTGGVWDKRHRQSSASRRCSPTFVHRFGSRGPDSECRRTRQAEPVGSTPWHHICAQINWTNGGE